jgi:hypothetical protein
MLSFKPRQGLFRLSRTKFLFLWVIVSSMISGSNSHEDSRFLNTACSSDGDCTTEQYCSSGTCRAFGACGALVDCLNWSNDYLVSDCVGHLLCHEGRCSKSCTGSFCPDGSQPDDCSPQPCAVAECKQPHTSCLDEYCGGCHAIFINAAGAQVCAEDDHDHTCSSEDDCGDSEFCSAGTCRAFGTCASLIDCLNLENDYLVPDCVGYLVCYEGSCHMSCTGSFCPNDDLIVDCFPDPCNALPCDQSLYDQCLPSYCGECNALFINATGHEVCDSDFTDDDTACSSDGDCESSEFCATGNCRAVGTCGSLLDCQNPANYYNIPKDCEGYLICNEAELCDLVCSDNACPDTVSRALCFEDPCKMVVCDEPHVSCEIDPCGVCKPIFFNAAGHQVCIGLVPDDTCRSNNHCDETSEFCSAGKCRKSGTCDTVLDCQNPSNEFTLITCEGYLICTDSGECARVCSEDMCPPDKELVEPGLSATWRTSIALITLVPFVRPFLSMPRVKKYALLLAIA